MPLERASYTPPSGYDPGERALRKIAQHLVRKAGLFPGDRAIDLTAGSGVAAVALARAFTRCRVAAVEPDAKEIERLVANARADHATARLDIVRADPAFLPFKDETFVLLVSAFGLARAEEPEEILDEAHRVAAFYGKLLLVEVDLTKAAKKPRGLARRALGPDCEDTLRDLGFGKVQRQKLEVLAGGVVVEGLVAKRFDLPEDAEDDDVDEDDDED